MPFSHPFLTARQGASPRRREAPAGGDPIESSDGQRSAARVPRDRKADRRRDLAKVIPLRPRRRPSRLSRALTLLLGVAIVAIAVAASIFILGRNAISSGIPAPGGHGIGRSGDASQAGAERRSSDDRADHPRLGRSLTAVRLYSGVCVIGSRAAAGHAVDECLGRVERREQLAGPGSRNRRGRAGARCPWRLSISTTSPSASAQPLGVRRRHLEQVLRSEDRVACPSGHRPGVELVKVAARHEHERIFGGRLLGEGVRLDAAQLRPGPVREAVLVQQRRCRGASSVGQGHCRPPRSSRA